MNKHEAKAAFQIACSDVDLSNVDNSVIFGYGLPGFIPVAVTLEMVAKEMRHHAMQLNGEWNSEALQEVINCGRRSFIILDLVAGGSTQGIT
jgi:hypothetical protein